MFDIGWPEFLVVLVVALLVVGPRDLPGALKQVGRWVRSARKVAREFQRHVDDAMREAELDDLKKGLDATRKFSVKKQIENLVDPDDELATLDKPGADKPGADKPAAAKQPLDQAEIDRRVAEKQAVLAKLGKAAAEAAPPPPPAAEAPATSADPAAPPASGGDEAPAVGQGREERA